MKNKRYIIIFLIAILVFFAMEAQKSAQVVVQSSTNDKNISQKQRLTLAEKQAAEEGDDDDDVLLNEMTVVPDDFTSSLDYLLQNWAIDKNAPSNCRSRENPETLDQQYKDRLQRLPHIIEMPFNSAVKSFIEVYTQKRRSQVESLLGLSNYYFPIFEEALESEKIPLELRYLPIIESALNPQAVSRAGATGIWQFMLSTGRMYDLEVNSLVDERMDPVKSSKAAARFLKELYSIYSDWHLAIAAYNCGPGNVNKAIRRADGKQDFWAIYPYLPAETRSYVPIFIAANYVMNYANEHNLCPSKVRLPVLTDTIMINKRLHLEQVASVLSIPIDEVRLLNPQYRKDIVPGDIKPYPLCLPHNYANLFIDKTEEVYAYNADVLINNRRSEVEVRTASSSKVSSQSRTKYTYHTVRKGQSISTIAQRYGISQARLKKANNLTSSKIRIGQRLKIPRK